MLQRKTYINSTTPAFEATRKALDPSIPFFSGRHF